MRSNLTAKSKYNICYANSGMFFSYELNDKFKDFKVDETTVKAKFSKKTGTLTLTIDKI